MTYKQQTFISHCSGVWEVKVKALVDLLSGEGFINDHLVSVSLHSGRREGLSLKSFIRH